MEPPESPRARLSEWFARMEPEVREIARMELRRGRVGETVDSVALVSEACAKLLRAHPDAVLGEDTFRAWVSRTMAHLLIDEARKRHAGKRGRGERAVTFSSALGVGVPAADPDLIQATVADRLERLEAHAPELFWVSTCRLVGGMSFTAIARASGETPGMSLMSEDTVSRRWAEARAWILRGLDRE